MNKLYKILFLVLLSASFENAFGWWIFGHKEPPRSEEIVYTEDQQIELATEKELQKGQSRAITLNLSTAKKYWTKETQMEIANNFFPAKFTPEVNGIFPLDETNEVLKNGFMQYFNASIYLLTYFNRTPDFQNILSLFLETPVSLYIDKIKSDYQAQTSTPLSFFSAHIYALQDAFFKLDLLNALFDSNATLNQYIFWIRKQLIQDLTPTLLPGQVVGNVLSMDYDVRLRSILNEAIKQKPWQLTSQSVENIKKRFIKPTEEQIHTPEETKNVIVLLNQMQYFIDVNDSLARYYANHPIGFSETPEKHTTITLAQGIQLALEKAKSDAQAQQAPQTAINILKDDTFYQEVAKEPIDKPFLQQAFGLNINKLRDALITLQQLNWYSQNRYWINLYIKVLGVYENFCGLGLDKIIESSVEYRKFRLSKILFSTTMFADLKKAYSLLVDRLIPTRIPLPTAALETKFQARIKKIKDTLWAGITFYQEQSPSAEPQENESQFKEQFNQICSSLGIDTEKILRHPNLQKYRLSLNVMKSFEQELFHMILNGNRWPKAEFPKIFVRFLKKNTYKPDPRYEPVFIHDFLCLTLKMDTVSPNNIVANLNQTLKFAQNEAEVKKIAVGRLFEALHPELSLKSLIFSKNDLEAEQAPEDIPAAEHRPTPASITPPEITHSELEQLPPSPFRIEGLEEGGAGSSGAHTPSVFKVIEEEPGTSQLPPPPAPALTQKEDIARIEATERREAEQQKTAKEAEERKPEHLMEYAKARNYHNFIQVLASSEKPLDIAAEDKDGKSILDYALKTPGILDALLYSEKYAKQVTYDYIQKAKDRIASGDWVPQVHQKTIQSMLEKFEKEKFSKEILEKERALKEAEEARIRKEQEEKARLEQERKAEEPIKQRKEDLKKELSGLKQRLDTQNMTKSSQIVQNLISQIDSQKNEPMFTKFLDGTVTPAIQPIRSNLEKKEAFQKRMDQASETFNGLATKYPPNIKDKILPLYKAFMTSLIEKLQPLETEAEITNFKPELGKMQQAGSKLQQLMDDIQAIYARFDEIARQKAETQTQKQQQTTAELFKTRVDSFVDELAPVTTLEGIEGLKKQLNSLSSDFNAQIKELTTPTVVFPDNPTLQRKMHKSYWTAQNKKLQGFVEDIKLAPTTGLSPFLIQQYIGSCISSIKEIRADAKKFLQDIGKEDVVLDGESQAIVDKLISDCDAQIAKAEPAPEEAAAAIPAPQVTTQAPTPEADLPAGLFKIEGLGEEEERPIPTEFAIIEKAPQVAPVPQAPPSPKKEKEPEQFSVDYWQQKINSLSTLDPNTAKRLQKVATEYRITLDQKYESTLQRISRKEDKSNADELLQIGNVRDKVDEFLEKYRTIFQEKKEKEGSSFFSKLWQ